MEYLTKHKHNDEQKSFTPYLRKCPRDLEKKRQSTSFSRHMALPESDSSPRHGRTRKDIPRRASLSGPFELQQGQLKPVPEPSANGRYLMQGFRPQRNKTKIIQPMGHFPSSSSSSSSSLGRMKIINTLGACTESFLEKRR